MGNKYLGSIHKKEVREEVNFKNLISWKSEAENFKRGGGKMIEFSELGPHNKNFK